MSTDSELTRELSRRRTFAIISHPDAGKTTLTEKFLLYAGRLRSAGSVRGRKGGAAATSDWMDMERQRGISITSSVLRIDYDERLFTILDTPGHADFSDDTYRTLTAADCAILLIDATKGVEPQTRKLCEVCRLQRIPVLIFVNKMDLEGREPFDLMSEIEQELDLHVVPYNWPAGQGRAFRGVVDRGLLHADAQQSLHLFQRTATHGSQRAGHEILPFPSEEAAAALDPLQMEALHEDLTLLEEAGESCERDDFISGRCCPLFFGSALTNFGLEPFFEAFTELAPTPGARRVLLPDGEEQLFQAAESTFSGYIYKIQSNMDPKHRDSLAFVRVCSGRLARDTSVQQVRDGQILRRVRISRLYTLAARDRETMEEAWPGDVVALPNTDFAIGDSLISEGHFWYPRLPQFTPTIFSRLELQSPQRRKQYDRALHTLSREGSVLVLQADERVIIAALGKLQMEVLQHRMRQEYGVEVAVQPLSYVCSAWMEGDPNSFRPGMNGLLTTTESGHHLALFSSEWERSFTIRKHPDHVFKEHW